MKAIIDIETAVELINNGQTEDLKRMLLQQLTCKTATKGKLNLYDFVAKDMLRPAINGVYHDAEKETAVATDSHIMIYTKDLYNPEHAGKIISKHGEEIAERYPNWKSVVPDWNQCDTVKFHFSAEQIEAAERNFIDKIGKITCKNYTHYGIAYPFESNVASEGLKLGVCTKYLKKLLTLGITELTVRARHYNYAAGFEEKEFSGIVMPSYVETI